MKKRFISILLLVALLASACGSAGTPAGTDSIEPAETTPADTRDVSDLPDTDLGGFTLRLLLQDSAASQNHTMYLFAPEEENGDVFNDAVYQRTTRMEEKYGFTVENIYCDSVVGALNTTVMAGDDEYDVALPQLHLAVTVVTSGLLQNLCEIENLNLTKNYWDQSFYRDLSIENKLYFGSGDILVSDDDNLIVTLYNTAMAKDYNIENLYDLAYAGKWTMDKFTELIKATAQDVDGDGGMAAPNRAGGLAHAGVTDTVGLLYASNNCAAPYFATAGVYVFAKDENDTPVLNGTSEQMFGIYDKMLTFLDQTRYACDWMRFTNGGGAITALAQSKQALFETMMLSIIRRLYRDVETDFGILPIPKYDESQEKYATATYKFFEVITVPATATATDKIGFTLEALASASDLLTDAYYNICLQSKYVRDEESFDMINLARENIVYDIGFIYDWGGLYSRITDAAHQGDAALASLIESGKNAAEQAMKNYVDAILALE